MPALLLLLARSTASSTVGAGGIHRQIPARRFKTARRESARQDFRDFGAVAAAKSVQCISSTRMIRWLGTAAVHDRVRAGRRDERAGIVVSVIELISRIAACARSSARSTGRGYWDGRRAVGRHAVQLPGAAPGDCPRESLT